MAAKDSPRIALRHASVYLSELLSNADCLMSIKAMLVKLLEDELAARGVASLAASDCEQIVERLIEQLTDFELSLAAKQIRDGNSP